MNIFAAYNQTNTMNFKVTSLVVLFTVFASVAQETFSVSGTVVTPNSKTAIAFANAVLLQQGTVVRGSSTDTSGRFVISNVSAGTYTLNISFLGFKTYVKEVTVAKKLNLGTVVLEKDTESLDDITITTKKPVLKREIDRLVFSVAGTALTEDNTWEVLRRTPGVIIINNELYVKNSPPIVYINDRRVYLSSSEIYQLLEGTPAQNVKSVEVITNPPARYDAQGGTILNIVMSKNLILGYNGSIFGNFTQGVFPRYSAGTSHFYKRDRLNVFGSYTYSHNKINRENDEHINYLNGSQITSLWDSDINRIRTEQRHNFNVNLDYEFDAKNVLSFSGNVLYNPFYRQQTITNTVVDDQTAQNEDFSLKAINNYNQDLHNIGLNVDYVHYFEKEGEKLSANVHYTDYDHANDQRVETDYTVVSATDFSTAFTTHANQKTNIFSGQVDYEIPLSETASFEAGIKAADIETYSNLIQFNIQNGVSVLDTNNSDTFIYDEAIYAAYLSYAKSWDTWSIKVGVRGEQTEIKGNSLSTNQINTQNYFELFPTVYVNHKVSDNVNLYVDFSRRIQRPSFDDLNPFRFNFTDFSFATGNPRLQPAISNSYKIGAEITDKFFIEAFYIYNNNEIYELTIQDNDSNVIQYIDSNVENNRYYGIDFVTYFSIANMWDVSLVTSLFNNEDNYTLPGTTTTTSQQKWSNYTSIDNNFTFLKDQSLTANLSLLYISSNIQGLSEVSNRSLVSLSLRKTLWNKSATVSLTVNDIFNGQEFTNKTIFANQNSSYRTNVDVQTVRVGFRYNFGNTKLRTNQRTKSSAEQERLKE